MQQLYTYMYLGLGVNPSKDCPPILMHICRKSTISIMTRDKFLDVFSTVMIRQFFSVSNMRPRESILRKKSYDLIAVELLALCADNILYYAVRNGCVLPRRGWRIPLKGWRIPRKGFEIPREEWITANTTRFTTVLSKQFLLWSINESSGYKQSPLLIEKR